MFVLRRVARTVGGGVLLILGLIMLVLPGPGLLVTLAGLLVLASEYPALDRYIEPVRRRALLAAQQSVATPGRLVLSALGGLGLIMIGAVWWWNPGVPLGGLGAGLGLIVSGLFVWGLLLYSLRRVRA